MSVFNPADFKVGDKVKVYFDPETFTVEEVEQFALVVNDGRTKHRMNVYGAINAEGAYGWTDGVHTDGVHGVHAGVDYVERVQESLPSTNGAVVTDESGNRIVRVNGRWYYVESGNRWRPDGASFRVLHSGE